MNTKQHSKRVRTKLTYANVMATIAVFMAMGGGAVAATHLGRGTVGTTQLKAGAVTGAKVKNQSLTGADVVASTLGKVPSAGRADSAAGADHATTAGHADSATSAEQAKHADTASSATTAASASSLAPHEQLRLIGDAGEPNYGPGTRAADYAGFYIDQEGIVHLEGNAKTTSEFLALLAILPTGYRPIEAQTFWGVSAKSSAHVYVERSGAVEIYGATTGETVSLSGITWQADLRPEA
jgi:hypothetical protein